MAKFTLKSFDPSTFRHLDVINIIMLIITYSKYLWSDHKCNSKPECISKRVHVCENRRAWEIFFGFRDKAKHVSRNHLNPTLSTSWTSNTHKHAHTHTNKYLGVWCVLSMSWSLLLCRTPRILREDWNRRRNRLTQPYHRMRWQSETLSRGFSRRRRKWFLFRTNSQVRLLCLNKINHKKQQFEGLCRKYHK